MSVAPVRRRGRRQRRSSCPASRAGRRYARWQRDAKWSRLQPSRPDPTTNIRCSFLRADPARRRSSLALKPSARDRNWVHVAGRAGAPAAGSAKGSCSIIEDETAWPISSYGRKCSAIPPDGAGLRHDQHQRPNPAGGRVVHILGRDLFDLSTELATVGTREVGFRCRVTGTMSSMTAQQRQVHQ